MSTDLIFQCLTTPFSASVRAIYYGNQDINWIGFYQYFREECDLVEETEKLQGLYSVAETCHWWIAYKDIFIVSNRPRSIVRNDMGRLNNMDGMAVEYRDGWGVYAINGVRLQEKYFNKPLTTNIIDSCTNTEQRRVLITKYGTQKYIQDSGSIKIHSDEWGTLYRKERQGDTPIEMVKVVNSTPEPDGTLFFNDD